MTLCATFSYEIALNELFFLFYLNDLKKKNLDYKMWTVIIIFANQPSNIWVFDVKGNQTIFNRCIKKHIRIW